MRILFDSKQTQFKSPFGTLVPRQECTLHIHIPTNITPSAAELILQQEDGTPAKTVAMEILTHHGAYEVFA